MASILIAQGDPTHHLGYLAVWQAHNLERYCGEHTGPVLSACFISLGWRCCGTCHLTEGGQICQHLQELSSSASRTWNSGFNCSFLVGFLGWGGSATECGNRRRPLDGILVSPIVRRHPALLLQAPRWPCTFGKRLSRDHCRGRSKPGCRNVGSSTREKPVGPLIHAKQETSTNYRSLRAANRCGSRDLLSPRKLSCR